MDIDVELNGDSLPIQVENPFGMDTEEVVRRISEFLEPRGVQPDGLRLPELLPRMVRGIAGCEQGCPADAQRLVHEGFHRYSLQYVEGGILKASLEVFDGKRLEIRMFPEF